MKRHNMVKGVLVLFLLLAVGSIANTHQVAAQVNSWEASYFDNANLEGRPVVRTFESQIRHDWGDGAPSVSSAMPADFFSARWIGQVVEERGRDYRLTATADDNIRVFVNADLVIDNWTATPGAQTSLVVGLGRGTHTIRVEYREFAANAYAHFDIHPADQAAPAPVADNPDPAPPASGGDGECVIPDSGPWPPCATGGGDGGGGGGATPPPSTGDCVIPASGPWPPCATEPSEPEPAPAPPSPGAQQPIIIGNGIKAYYAFDEGTGFAVDSANGVNGTISANVERILGQRNNAVRLTSGGSVFIPDNPNNQVGTSDFSIGMWLRVSQSQGVQRIMDKRATSPSIVGYHMFTWDGKIGMQLADGNGDVNRCKFDSGQPRCTNYITDRFIADGQWHFVMVTVDRDDSNGMRFYVDGVLAQTMDPTGRQGSLNSGQNTPFVLDSSGSTLDVDELYLYGRSLGAGEVSQLFNNR